MAETFGLILLEAVASAALAETTVGAGGFVTTVTPSFAGVSFFGVSAASLAGSAALLAVSTAVAFATAPNTPKPSDGTQSLKQAIPPRPFGYGRARLAGAYVLYEVDSVRDESQDVIAIHQGKIAGFVLFYLNDDLVYLENGASGGACINVLTPDGKDGRYSNSGYIGGTDKLLIEVRLGAATETAYSNVVSNLPQFWTNSHRGDGIASLHMRCQNTALSNFPHLWPHALPKPSVVADLAPVWDPRAGGQSRSNPATWAVSSNPVLQLIDYLTSGAGYGEVRGPDLDYDEIIAPVLAAWMAQADICDELVTKADGNTEKRYQSNGWAFLTSDPAEVLGTILATCDGWLAEGGDGTLTLQVGKYSTPTVILQDENIVGISIDHGVPDEEVVNELRLSYTPPANHYREAAGVAWQDTASIAEIGKVRSRPMALTWVQSHSQARRLAKRAMLRHQAAMRGTMVTTLFGLVALGKRWVRVQSDNIGAFADIGDAIIEIYRARVDLANARVTFEWGLVNPNSIDAWDPATEEGAEPNYYPVPGTAGASPSITISDAGGGSHRIHVQFTDPKQNQLAYAIEFRVGASGPWTRHICAPPDGYVTPTAGTAWSVGAGNVVLLSAAVAPGTYNVRVATIGPQGIAALGNWTSLAGTSVVIA